MNKAMLIVSMSLLATAIGVPAQAQQILKQEPGKGALSAGAVVYVDDGTCPKGQIKKVTGGSNVSGGTAVTSGQGRQRSCVKR
jgi:hypothetical protein